MAAPAPGVARLPAWTDCSAHTGSSSTSGTYTSNRRWLAGSAALTTIARYTPKKCAMLLGRSLRHRMVSPELRPEAAHRWIAPSEGDIRPVEPADFPKLIFVML